MLGGENAGLYLLHAPVELFANGSFSASELEDKGGFLVRMVLNTHTEWKLLTLYKSPLLVRASILIKSEIEYHSLSISSFTVYSNTARK